MAPKSSGLCVSIAPALFALPSGAYCASVLKASTDDAALIALAEDAAAQCPTQAITVSADADD